ncbi:integrin beta-1-B-like [Xenia sp. Carnegie-2017]|uniref:integrin beta-1-B-like n=1 Tax=Xenia sp. Carnegie-2017 TaxID=2897299 RepID=UPI001F03D084|nr:integrin beta-1-B-like [Xenia sp. Carnegie-2017]XP_046846103.1 integrin beta-1-B-like [Xenia sp. Carnegie-2017]
MMRALLLFATLQFIGITYGQSSNCERQERNTCSECLQLVGCAWCSEVNYTSSRCNTEKNHVRLKCNMTVTGNPDKIPNFDASTLNNNNQISPRLVKAKIRVGEPLKFNFLVRPSKDYPVDFYILMDLSLSMNDDLNSVKRLAVNISDKLNELTSNHRLAFGSFVDKVVPPFVKFEDIGKPFSVSQSEKGDPPYDFKHIQSFTNSSTEFRDKVSEQTVSGNRDVPEGLFDALMQVVVCEKELDWRSKETTRKMVLIVTDATFHIAGEGRFGGVANPNEARCSLNATDVNGVRFYNKSLIWDYPSPSKLYGRILSSGIQPIFAVSSQARGVGNVYEALAKTWEDSGATYGSLSSDSRDIIQLIQDSYDKITSEVQLKALNTVEGVEVEIKQVNCTSPGADDRSCSNVKPGETVEFSVSATVTSCEKHGNSTSFLINAAGFGSIQVDLEVICRCDCEDIKIPNSPRCNYNGSLVCGGCQCNEGWSGGLCQCDTSLSSGGVDEGACINPNDTRGFVCDGNGECDCGVCRCNIIPGREDGEKYYGQYCQCSDFSCPRANNKICGGKDQGKCRCGTCQCEEGFLGSNCGRIDCSYHAKDCLIDDENGVKVNCSNKGICQCDGTCRCDSFYEGKHCEKCPSCGGRCGDFKTCVLCKVFDPVPENRTLCDACPSIKELTTLSDLIKEQLPTTCEERDDEGCTYFYSYEEKNNVTTLYVVKTKDCPEGPDVLTIVLAVIGGIVGIGIILLILWKLFTAMVDRREYQKFEQDRAKSKWHREKNPLYQPAVSTVQNPTFVGKS